MGYHGDYSSKEILVKNLTRSEGGKAILDFSLVGNCLWSVWEREGKRIIKLDLIVEMGKYWVYKPLCEADQPYYYSCPLRFFKLVPVPASDEWRELVKVFHSLKNENRRLKKAGLK